MKLIRLLQRLDDLAEVLLFDVLLATPRRRRFCAALAAGAGAFLYVISSFLMAPSPVEPAWFAPATAAAPALDKVHEDLVMRALDENGVSGTPGWTLVRFLRQHRPELDRIAVTRDFATLAQWRRVVGPRRAADIALMLMARGAVYRDASVYMSAHADWLAALRLGAALTIPQARTDDVTAHTLGLMVQTRAVRLLCRDVRAGRFTKIMAAEAARDLRYRPQLTQMIAVLIRQHQADAEHIIDTWVRTNALPTRWRGMRGYLPWYAANRREVGRLALAHMRRTYDEQATGWARGLPARPHTYTRWHGFYLTEKAGLKERALSMVSNEAAATVLAELAYTFSTPGYSLYGAECQDRDVEIGTFYDHCRELAFDDI